MVRVAIVADIRLYREGLEQALERDGRIMVVASAASVAEAPHCLADAGADVILLDLATPHALENVRTLASLVGGKVVALGVSEVEEGVIACAEAGVSGYIVRDASLDQLIACLEAVARGELSCSPLVAGALLRRVGALAAGRAPIAAQAPLTSREREVVALIDQGLSNKEIARQLTIEVATVKNHIHNALEKLGAKRRSEAAAMLRHPSASRRSSPLS
jgi:DNA-binding NarL/FixJ family response regulator